MISAHRSPALLLLTVMIVSGCRDEPPAKGSSRELMAIKTARAAIQGYLLAAKNDPMDAHDTDVMLPAYERGLEILRTAEDAGLDQPKLLVTTIATLPNGVWLELLWLDAGFNVTGVRLRKRDQPQTVVEYAALVQWTESDKQVREQTAYRHEAYGIDPQDGRIDTTVRIRDGRPVIEFPRDWLRSKLEASLLFGDGTTSDWIAITARAASEEPN